MAVFLTIHARYKDVEWGIFRDSELIEASGDESKKVSENFLIMLGDLLQRNRLSFSDLSFIATHLGPAPFTTLRVCIASVNGFAFATGVPLVGVDGLEALLNEYAQKDRTTVVMLNAFCHEVYYAIDDPFSKTRKFGHAPAEKFIQDISKEYQGPFTFLGNGTTLYHELITNHIGEQAQLLPVELASLETIAKKGLEDWHLDKTHQVVTPVYLKGSAPHIQSHTT